jgi:DNA-binding NarL/FixJ family response regulator
LSAPAWRAVLLSALNRSGTSATVAAALVREGVDVAAALDEAQNHGVLVRQGADIGFRHPLLRTSVMALAPSAQQRSAHRVLADVLAKLNDVAGVVECAARIEEAADYNDPEQRMLSDFTRGLAASLTGDLAAGQGLLRDVTERIALPPLRDDPRSLLFLGLATGYLGDPREAMALGSHQLSQVRNRGALGLLVPALALFAAARAWLGDHAGAFADAGEAAELGEQLGYAADAAVAVELVAWQSAARGLHEDARTALERARALTDRAGTTGFAAHQALTAAFCALCRADPAAAVSLLEARVAADGGVGSMGEPLGVAPDLVEAYLAVGRRDKAIAMAERFAAVTPPAAPPWLRALVARCRGLTADDDETAAEAYEAALAAHAEAPDVFETARTHILYGARLRRSGQRVKAREQLRTAQDAFAEMDLTAWVLRAADELAATGAKPRTRRPQLTEPLTSQETRVALHAAKGMSNKEIAAALFLSPKTVEHHLSSVYRKRGFRSRAELAGPFRPREEG